MRGQLGPVMLDLSAYRAGVRNELLQFNIGPDIPASTFNADQTVHQGIEAGLELPLGAWATLSSTYQFNDFRFDNDRRNGDNRLPVIPKHLVRAQVRLGPDAWGATPGIEWVPRGAWADYANTFRTNGYTLFNIGGSVSLSKNTEFFVDLRNLTNKKAAGDISAVVRYAFDNPATPNVNESSAIFYPVERRSFAIGIRQRLGGGDEQ